MKTKLIISAVFILSVTAYAQNGKVPSKTRDAFAKLYPKISEVKWSKEKDKGFEAEFKQDGKSISVVIDNEGKLLETETDIDIKELPGTVEPFINKNHPGHKITWAAKIVNEKGEVTYEVEISKGKKHADVIFDENGNPVVKEG